MENEDDCLSLADLIIGFVIEVRLKGSKKLYVYPFNEIFDAVDHYRKTVGELGTKTSTSFHIRMLMLMIPKDQELMDLVRMQGSEDEVSVPAWILEEETFGEMVADDVETFLKENHEH